MTTPADVIGFWTKAGPARWFDKSDAFDQEIRERFEAAHHAAARGEFAGWGETAEGALALLLLLDQFPRNLFRGSAHAFATDPLARRIAERAIAAGHDLATGVQLRQFFYLPFEHSEALADQDRCLELMLGLDRATGDEDWSKWANIHRDIIVRFGRFPHRNTAFGRQTTPEEQAFLDSGGFKG
ncbi:DUF924 family protein [Phenylobacterium montanum]|uniref:DUF924 family protein n=1 Tax=Phenylobacterium montanum TaxID=2823693 RepID=A0A975IWM6_9CAUL|nr:DUF924 family protein [Caulobacter sp. S6]QUD90000.1 DUF924 family protein [Caulobacter sp. S6]